MPSTKDMTPSLEEVVRQLSDSDHFVVCRALKDLGGRSDPSPEILDRVVELLASPLIAVEKNALKTLVRFGSKAKLRLLQVLSHFVRRIGDGKGCDYSCCGFGAYYAPVELYVEAILAIVGPDHLEAVLSANTQEWDEESVEEIRFLLSVVFEE